MSINEGPGRRQFVKHLAAGIAAAPILATAEGAFAQTTPKPPAGNSTHDFTFNILDFGAVPDGATLNTKAIQEAVDSCAQKGGGKVVIPPGRYVSGPIFLKSNLELELMSAATLLGSTNFDHYPAIPGRWEGLDRTIFASLLTGKDLENVTISGTGTLDGQGEVWWNAHRETAKLRKTLGLEGREPENPPNAPLKWPRPRMINLYNCKNVRISGLKIVNSPSWNVHPVLCEDIYIDGLTIVGPGNSPNTDGIDPDSCRRVRISNCYISTGDDCVVIKSGYKYLPGVTQTPSEDVVVSNCVFGTGHAGVAIGSETSGGVRNVTVSNCVCNGTRRGLYIKSARGRGNIVENFRATNVVMKDIIEGGIVVGMYYTGADRDRILPKNEATPTFRNFHFANITLEGAQQGAVIEGLPENPIREISLSNVVLNGVKTGISCSGVENGGFENIQVNADSGASAAFRNVQDVEISRIRTLKSNSAPLLQLQAVKKATISSCSAAEGSSSLVEVRGPDNAGIALVFNRVPKGMQEVALADGASATAVEKRA
jgi:polygalacturonase